MDSLPVLIRALGAAVHTKWLWSVGQLWRDESAAVDEAQLRSDRYLEDQRIRGRLSDSEC